MHDITEAMADIDARHVCRLGYMEIMIAKKNMKAVDWESILFAHIAAVLLIKNEANTNITYSSFFIHKLFKCMQYANNS